MRKYNSWPFIHFFLLRIIHYHQITILQRFIGCFLRYWLLSWGFLSGQFQRIREFDLLKSGRRGTFWNMFIFCFGRGRWSRKNRSCVWIWYGARLDSDSLGPWTFRADGGDRRILCVSDRQELEVQELFDELCRLG